MLHSWWNRVKETLSGTRGRRGRRTSAQSGRGSRKRPLSVEALEDRMLPTTYSLSMLGPIFGNVTVPVASFQFNSSTAGPNGPNFGALQVTTAAGAESASTLSALASGGQLVKAVLTAEGPPLGGSAQTLETWTLSNAFITSISESGPDPILGNADETLTLDYAAVSEEFFRTSSSSSGVTASWSGSSSTGPATFGGQTVSARDTIAFGSGQAAVQSWSAALSDPVRSLSPPLSAGAQPGAFTVSIAADMASPAIFHAFTQKTVLPSVGLTIDNIPGPGVFETITLSQVTITSDAFASHLAQQPTETFTLSYGKIAEQVNTGGGAITSSWDFNARSGTAPGNFGAQQVSAPTVIGFGSGQSQVASFAANFANPVNAGSLTAAGAQAGTFQVTIPAGAASPGILSALTRGRELTHSVALTSSFLDGEIAQKLILYGVFITGDTITCTAGQVPSETFTLQYGGITELASRDGAQNTSTAATWDLVSGKVTAPSNFGLQTVTKSGSAHETLDFGSGQVALTSFSGGFTPAGNGSTTLHDFQFTAPVGLESAPLLGALASSETLNFPVVLTVVVPTASGGSQTRETFTLSGVRVTGQAFSWSQGDASPEETFTLDSAQVKETTNPGGLTATVSQTTQGGVSLAPLPGPGVSGIDRTKMKYFIQLNGSLQGIVTEGSRDPAHPHYSDVAAFSYSSSAAGSQAGFGDLTVSIREASANLLSALAMGTAQSITATLVAAAQSVTSLAWYDFATWTLPNVQITADGSSDVVGSGPLETLTLQFTAITETITPAGVKPITASWNLATGTGSGPTTFGGQTVRGPITLDFGSGQVAVGSFSTGMDRSANADNAGIGGLAANGPLTFQDLVFTMPAGAASPAVLAALSEGTVLAKPVVLTVAAKGRQPAQTLTFGNVRVVGDQFSFGTGDANSEETVELQYGSVSEGHTGTITPTVVPVIGVTDQGGAYNGLAYTVTGASVVANGATIASLGDPKLSFTYYAGSYATAAALAGVVPLNQLPVHAGTYTVVAHYAGDNINYAAVDSQPVTFTISAATLTITANPETKTYGTPDPTLTFQVSGLLAADSGGLAGHLTRASGQTVAGGPYAISQGTLTADSNYTISFTGNTLTITPAPLAITANARTKVYGNPDPTFTYQVSGLKFTDTAAGVLTGSLTRAAGESVAGGPYTISQGTLTSNSNYTISFTGNTLTVTPAALTVTANAQTKVYGSSDPTFTYVVSGLKFTDTATTVLTGSLTRAAGESVAGGPYAIRRGTLAANSNYSIHFTGNTLTVQPATPTVTVTAAGGIGNGSPEGVSAATVTGPNGITVVAFGDPSLSYTYYAGAFTSAAQLAGQTPLPAAPSVLGAYTVVAHWTNTAGNPNYTNADSAPFTFTIQKAPSLVVDTTLDETDPFNQLTSLREAIAYADTLPGNPTITFDPTAFSGPQTITLDGTGLPNITNNMTIVGPGADQLTIDAAGQSYIFATVSGTVSISGLTLTNGSNGNEGGAIFNSANLTLTDAVLSNNTGGYGGGLAEEGGSATLMNVTLQNNTANQGWGGGVYNDGGSVTLDNVSLIDNTAAAMGGGIYSDDQATLVNVTVAGNYSAVEGGGVFNDEGSMTLVNATITNNSAPLAGGIGTDANTITLTNTIVVGNTDNSGPSDIVNEWGGIEFGNVTGSYNLIGADLSGQLTNGVNGNQVGVTNALLGTLGNYGGDAPTIPLLPGSPAIDAGTSGPGIPTTDQRGVSRPQGAANDIGAFEYDLTGPQLYVSQTSLNLGTSTSGTAGASMSYTASGSNLTDNVSISAPTGVELSTDGATWSTSLTLTPSNGTLPPTAIDVRISALAGVGTLTGTITDTSTGAAERDINGNGSVQNAPGLVVNTTLDTTNPLDPVTSLREAIAYADTLPGNPTITFDPTVFSGPQTITLDGTALPNITNSMTIVGPGAGQLTINAGNQSGIFTINSGTVSLSGLTLENGSGPADGGGAILNYSGNVSLTDAVLSNNSAPIDGGGFANYWGAATLTDVTLTGNSGPFGGGFYDLSGNVTFINDTLDGNYASGTGGAFEMDQGGTATFINDTITNNVGGGGGGIFGTGGGIYVMVGDLVLTNTIVAGNTSGSIASDIFMENLPNAVSGSNNLIGTGGSGGLVNGVNGNQVGVTNPLLGTLGNYGGDTPTIPLLPGSPAIDAGTSGPGIPTTDQRGVSRPQGAANDIGAFEYDLTGSQLYVSQTSLNLGTTTYGTPGTSMTYTASGSNLTDNVSITAPTGVELSTDGATWSTSLTLTPSNGTLPPTVIDVRISALADAGTIAGNIADTSTGAVEQDVSLSGNVNPAALTVTIIGDPTKIFDFTTVAILTPANYQIAGLVNGDSFTVTNTSGNYTSSDVGTTTVTVSLAGTDFTAAPGTLDNNYIFPTTASGPGQIIPIPAP